LLAHSPRVKLSTNLLDAHVYILAREPLLQLLQARHELTSLREHVLPLLARASWQTGLLEKALSAEEAQKAAPAETEEDTSAKWHDEAVARSTVLLVNAKERLAAGASAPAGKKTEAKLRIQALVLRLAKDASSESGAAAKEGTEFVARANTVPTFLECTRFVSPSLFPNSDCTDPCDSCNASKQRPALHTFCRICRPLPRRKHQRKSRPTRTSPLM
jgi:hypothetical protein